MKYILIAISLVFFLSALILAVPDRAIVKKPIVYQPKVTFTPTPTLRPYALDADKLFQLVNSWRTENGYQPYIKSEFACSVVDIRLPEVYKNFSHDGFYASRFCNSEGCTLSENLIRNYPTEEEALDAWLHSPDHLRDLKAPYTHSCLKCEYRVCDQTFTYF